MHFPEIGVALVSGEAAADRGMRAEAFIAADSPVHSIDPEYFMFATDGRINTSDYLRGVLRATEMIRADLGESESAEAPIGVLPQVLGATWGLIACKVPWSCGS